MVLLVSLLEDGIALLETLVDLLLLRVAHVLWRILIGLLLLIVAHVLLLWIDVSLLNYIECLAPRPELLISLIVLVSSSSCSLPVISIPSGFLEVQLLYFLLKVSYKKWI